MMRRTDAYKSVIGNDDARIRLIAAQNHMTAALTAKDETNPLQGGSDLAAGEVNGQLCHTRPT